MHNPHGNKRRIRATHVFGLTAILVLLLACAVRVDAAVDLLYFRATGFENYVLVEWATAQEMEHAQFKLYREYPELGQNRTLILQEPLDPDCIMIGCDYSYEDYGVDPGVTYYYWLEDVDLHGVSTPHGPESATPGPSATATPTSAPTETPTSTPTASATPTQTEAPTLTPTGVPSATSAGAPTATATSPPGTTPSGPATSAPTGASSPTPSIVPTGEAPTETAPRMSEVTPSGTATTHAVAAPTEPGATSSPPAGTGWATISIPTILVCVSGASFVGVLLLSMVLVLVRKFGL